MSVFDRFWAAAGIITGMGFYRSLIHRRYYCCNHRRVTTGRLAVTRFTKNCAYKTGGETSGESPGVGAGFRLNRCPITTTPGRSGGRGGGGRYAGVFVEGVMAARVSSCVTRGEIKNEMEKTHTPNNIYYVHCYCCYYCHTCPRRRHTRCSYHPTG